MRIFLVFSLLLFFGTVMGQKAIITGVITDSSNVSETLPGVSITVKNTQIGTQTDFDGNYKLELLPGDYTLLYSFIGYDDLEAKIKVKAGDKIVVNQSLQSNSISIEEIVINVVQSREKVSALLKDRQQSVEIKQNIGAQELNVKGISDVASAVAKTSGVSKQEGSGNVYVRGLGDRYNSTSLNGLPVPSNDPEKKNIDLGIFSTDIVETISIDKVYGSRISGDFAGGNIDISSKNYRGNGMFEISMGSAINTNAMEKWEDFKLQDGPSYFGFSNYGVPNNALQGYNFQNSLVPQHEAPFAGNIGLKAGKSFDIGSEGRLNLFATANFDNGFEYREGINQSVDAHGIPLKSFQQERFSYKTNSTGMFNANYSINDNHKIGYNFLFINSSNQRRETYKGHIRDLAEDNNGLVQRGTYEQNTLMVNQLLGNHKLSESVSLDWGASFGSVEGDMPDRTQNILVYRNNINGYTFGQNTVTDNHRYYQNLVEDEIAANVVVSKKIGMDENGEAKGKISVGYNGRFKERNFEAIQFNFDIAAGQRESTVVDPNNLDAFLNQENYQNGLFTISSFAAGRYQTYNGEQNIHAGLLNLEYKLSEKLSSIVGLRFEKVEQTVDWVTQLSPEGGVNKFDRNEFLPSIILKYELNEKQNLRFGASKTYTLPQFKERALFIYEDVTEIKVGNPDLYPSQNYNVDIKWEMFPESEEIYSVTAFGKYIIDPMNETSIASSTNDVSFINTGDYGYVYGVEVEVRKNIFSFDEEQANKLSVGFNAAYMQTYQELSSEKVRTETRYNINLTDEDSGFTGASDLLLNADLSYLKEWKNDASVMATLAYSHFSDRLYALGSEGKGNQVDKATGALDFVLKTKIDKNFGINFSAKNILDPTYKRVQENSNGDVPVLSYKKGAFFSLGFSYQF